MNLNEPKLTTEEEEELEILLSKSADLIVLDNYEKERLKELLTKRFRRIDDYNNRTKSNGRPTKLNNENIEIFLAAIRKGCFIDVAASLAGWHRDTFFKWMRTAKDYTDAIAEYEYRTILQEEEGIPYKPSEEVLGKIRVASNSSGIKDLLRFFYLYSREVARTEVFLLSNLTRASQSGHVGATVFLLQKRFAKRWAGIEEPGAETEKGTGFAYVEVAPNSGNSEIEDGSAELVEPLLLSERVN